MKSLSRLTVGTVQFGLAYGIANRTGKPPYETARDILALALEGGVNSLDTAAAYGDSESILGRALAELDAADRVCITTKIPALPAGLTPAEAERRIAEAIDQSRRNLRRDRLDICLFHREEDAVYLEALAHAQAAGCVDRIGVSTYHPGPTAALLDRGAVQAVQIPTSILDQRFIRSGTLDPTRARGVTVFVRSVFLQGLLFLPAEKLAPFFAPAVAARAQLEPLARSAGLTPAELAVRFVLSLDAVSSLVLGVETVEQIRDNLRLCHLPPLPPDLFQAAQAAVPDLPDTLLMPMFWPK